MKNRVKVVSLCALYLMMEGAGVMSMVTLTEDQTMKTTSKIKYAVTCLDDAENRVRTTRRDFGTLMAAKAYNLGVAEARLPMVYAQVDWGYVEWLPLDQQMDHMKKSLKSEPLFSNDPGFDGWLVKNRDAIVAKYIHGEGS